MDYKKAYEAALETATQWIKYGCTEKEKICLECVFPELRESEGERIINAIEIIIHENCYGDTTIIDGVEIAEIINWLEEQKINTEGDFGRGYDCGYQAGYSVAMNEMKPKVATATLDSEEQAMRIIKKRMCYDPVPISDEDRRIVENWLEKQGELFEPGRGLYYYDGEKTTYCGYPATEENPYDFAMNQQEKQKEPHYTKRNALFDKCVENCDPEVMKEVSDKVDEMLGKEQKPLTDFEAAIYSYLSDDTSGKFNKEVMHKCAVERAKILLELARKEQEPAEWSEEDIKKIRSEEYTKGFNDAAFGGKLKEWSEEDKTMINHIIEALPKWANGLITILPSQAEEYVKRLKSLRPQPKQEWSEEDERILKGIIGKIDHDQTYGVAKVEMLSFLKSLRPSWRPSQWNREDKNVHNYLCDLLRETWDKVDKGCCIDDAISWLEELPTRVSLSSWKPSEEQMSMLLAVINDPNNAGSESCHLALKSIYEQLKKL